VTNRLALETSPYLQQHQDNPVDWYPWGDEALARAKTEDKPILLSIGYSACHWCHVMAHESFEQPSIAEYLNQHFISIKVDREERPDIDSIYMTAVQAMTGQGGWPLNAFLTPEGVPFFAGTYWPPADRMGMPGFLKVVQSVNQAWTTNRAAIVENAGQIRAYLREAGDAVPQAGVLTIEVADDALATVARQFDPQYGGFGNAPKFPQGSILEFLLRHHRRTNSSEALAMALTTLDRMASGGINDQIGGGFARYSVDRIWLVPHFEKMLYDNAQLMSLYLDAWRITHEANYRAVAEAIATWVLRDMTSPEGAFHASLDADSEGVEGRYYVWTEAQLEETLAEDFSPEEIDLVKLHYGVTTSGNFEGSGSSIFSIVQPIDELAENSGQSPASIANLIERAANVLLRRRASRVAPSRDEKIVASWNGLMLKAFAVAGAAFESKELLTAASRNADFLLAHLRDANGRLARTWRDGTLRGNGTLEDYAFMADGLIALYGATGEIRWLDAAGELLDIIVDVFPHPSGIGFYDTAADHESLIIRPRDLQDGATPSGNAVTCDLLMTFGILRDDDRLLALAERTLASLVEPMRAHPVFMGRYLAVLERWLSPRRDLVLAGDTDGADFSALHTTVAGRYEPLLVLGFTNGTDQSAEARYPMLANRPVPENAGTGAGAGAGAAAAAYVCEHYACLPPVMSSAALIALLDR